MTQFGEGECLTFPIKIIESPPARLQEAPIKESAVIDQSMTDDSGVKLLIDDAAEKYYTSYIKAYEVNWLKNEGPFQTSVEQEKADEKEIQESQANFETSQKHAAKIQEDRLQMDLDQLKQNAISGVELKEVLNGRWVLNIEGPENSIYSGQHFTVSLSFSSDYPFSAPLIRFDSKNIEHGCISGDDFTMNSDFEWQQSSTASDLISHMLQMLADSHQQEHEDAVVEE